MTTDNLADILNPAQLGDMVFRGAPRLGLPGNVFGGQLLGQSVTAAGRTVPPGYLPHSLHAYFERPGDWARPIDYLVDATRDGRSSARRRVVAVQGADLLATVELSLRPVSDAHPEADHPAVDAGQASWTPEPADDDHARQLRSWLAALTSMLRLDVRFFEEPARSRVLRTGSAPPRQRFLVRPADPLPKEPLLHAAAVAYLSDMFLLSASLGPLGVVMGDRRLRAVSLDHSLWFSPRPDAQTWLLHETTTVRSWTDRALCRGQIYDLAGRAVADSTQEGLVRLTHD
ncbi:acyl-CoA thioesterase [Gordonia rubripertincta]|uniref:acyl-CoA thioesterase n=1 Tax=Gordonia rubripertincta TaxID=36822 RepID=UPI000B8DA2BD|nr:Acyl-CoA thioesterase 2 [Gordonia rubripertincta]